METVRHFGCWFSNNWADLGNILFAAVVAWTAWAGVKLNRRLAEAELDPAISIYIEPDRVHWSFFDLVIKNAGRGAAWNVRFSVSPDIPIEPGEPDSRLSRMSLFQDGINFMAPFQEIRSFYGSFMTLSKEPITISVQYERDTPEAKRRKVQAKFILDVAPFAGLSRVGEPPELTTAKALKKMADDLHAIKSGGSHWTPTISVRRRYIFSRWANELHERWFGSRYLNRHESAWKYFRNEVNQAVRNSRAVGRFRRKSEIPRPPDDNL